MSVAKIDKNSKLGAALAERQKKRLSEDTVQGLGNESNAPFPSPDDGTARLGQNTKLGRYLANNAQDTVASVVKTINENSGSMELLNKNFSAWAKDNEHYVRDKKSAQQYTDLFRKYSSTVSAQMNKLRTLNLGEGNVLYDVLAEQMKYFTSNTEWVNKLLKYSSNFNTELDERKHRHGWLNDNADTDTDTASSRSKIYDDNKSRIAEIDEEMKKHGRQYTTTQSSDGHVSVYYVGWGDKGKYKELKAEKERLEAENRQYDRTQGKTDSNYRLTRNADFMQNSQPGENNNPSYEAMQQWRADFENARDSMNSEWFRQLEANKPVVDDKLALYDSARKMNETEDFFNTHGGESDTWGSYYAEGQDARWDLLTDEERSIYYYLRNTQGKEAGDDFLDSMATVLGKRAVNESAKKINDMSGTELVLNNIASVPLTVLGNIGAFANTVSQLITGKEFNPYSVGNRIQAESGMIRGETASRLNDATNNFSLLGQSAGDVYQALMSAADSAVGVFALGSPLHLAQAGMGALTSTARELYERGASGSQILGVSVAAGVFEVLFEKVSIDKFTEEIIGKPTKNVAEIIKKMLIQGGTEASEEFCTELANMVTEYAILGDRQRVNDDISRYMQDGDTKAAATSKAVFMNLYDAAMGGFISGGAMGGVGGLSQYARHHAVDVPALGREIIANDETQKLIETAHKLSGAENNDTKRLRGENRTFEKLAKKVESNPTEKNVGLLADRLETTAEEARHKVRTAQINELTEESGLNGVEKLAKKRELRKLSENELKQEFFKHSLEKAVKESSEKNEARRTEVESFDKKIVADDKKITAAVKNGATNKLVENRHTGVRSDGLEVSLGAITGVENGKITVEYDGDTHSAAVFDADTRIKSELHETGKEMFFRSDTPDGANVSAPADASGVTDVKDTPVNTVKSDNAEINTLYTQLGKAVSGTVEADTGTDVTGKTVSTGTKMSITAANLALSLYSEGINTDAAAYSRIMYEAYKAGKNGLPSETFKQSLTGLFNNTAYDGIATDAQLNQMYKAGVSEMKARAGVTRIGVKSVTTGKYKHALTQLSVIDEFARRYGLSIIVVDSLYDAEGNAINGEYRTGNNIVISLDADGGLYMPVVGHEVFHYAESVNPEDAKILVDMVTNTLKAKKGVEWLDARRREYEGYGYKDGEIDSEIAADFFGAAITEKEFARQVGTAEMNKSFTQKVVDKVKEVVAELKEIMAKLRGQRLIYDATLDMDNEMLDFFVDNIERILNQAGRETKNTAENSGVKRQAKIGETDDGRGIYKTNYAKGTPKSVKQQDIIDLVQNVWSKKPISLYITENNTSRKITANFDPNLSERSDLAKIVYGNKKGTASEKRMTLDLSSDLYRIATEAKNSGNLSEKGKINPTHNGVTDWHYFVTNIVYEDDNGERTDCHMNIDVKEKPSGNFFYSFAIEKGTAPQTLLAVVADEESTTVPIISISDSSEKSNLKNRNSEKNISHQKKQVKLDVTEYSDDERKQHSADAKAYFGKTYNWKETGYILRNGDKLDFSGRHEGAPGGYRTVDHRDIADAMPDGYGGNDYSGAMVQFMSEGNIRISPENGGINLSVLPTKAQFDSISDFIGRNRGEIILDIDNIGGDTVASVEYPRGTHSSKIVSDIKVYFENGTIPTVSEYAKFRFQRKLPDVQESLRRMRQSEDVSEAVKHAEALTEKLLEIIKAERLNGTETSGLIPQTTKIADIVRKYNDFNRTGISNKQLASDIFDIFTDYMNGVGSSDTLINVLTDMIMKRELNSFEVFGDDAFNVVREYTEGGRFSISDETARELIDTYGSLAEINAVLKDNYGFTVARDSDRRARNRTPWAPTGAEIASEAGYVYEGTDYTENAKDGFEYETLASLMQTAENDPRIYRGWLTDANSIEERIVAQDELADYVSEEALKMFGELMSAPSFRTQADRYRSELSEYADRYFRQAERYKKRLDENKLRVEEIKAENRAKIKDIRNANAEKVSAVKKAYGERLDAQKERQRDRLSRAKLRSNITKSVKTLNSLLTRETDQKHVPQELKHTVAQFLLPFTEDSSVFGTSRDDVLNLERYIRMRDVLTDIYNSTEGDSADGTVINEQYKSLAKNIDSELLDDFDRLRRTMAGKRLSELSAEELTTIKNIVANITHLVKNGNETRINNKKTTVAEVGGEAIRQLSERTNRKKRAKPVDWMVDLMNDKNTTPIYFFAEKLGGVFGDCYEDFRDAQDNWFRKCEEAQRFFKETQEKYGYDKWSGNADEGHTFTLETTGEKITLTTGQILSIFATLEREHRSGNYTSHVFDGGIVFEDEMKKKVKLRGDKTENRKKVAEYIKSEARHLTVNDIASITAVLTEAQRSYANEIVGFLSTTAGGWGNETSMDMYGFKKFVEDYYFPITSDKSYLYTRFGITDDTRLKHMGFTNKVVKGANNPILVTDFTKVAANHINQMALYSSFTVPIENLTRVYNYEAPAGVDADGHRIRGTSVKTALTNAYGKAANDYISEFVRAVNGGIKADNLESFLDWGTSKFKRAAVLANASVVIQQPSAIARSLVFINGKYFFGIKPLDKRAVDEMYKYSAVAGIKKLGGFDTGTGMSVTQWISGDSGSLGDRISDALGKGAEKADEYTWAHIWAAEKRQTNVKIREGKLDLEIGSQEYFDYVAKQFRNVIDYTQVYDSVMSKSQLMRSKSSFVRMTTAFMAEPTLSYNLVVNSFKGSTIHSGKAIAAFASNVILNTLLQSLVAAWRDDDDASYWERYIKAVTETFSGGVKTGFVLGSEFNVFNNLPVIKDVLSILQGFDVERTDISLVSNAGNILRKLLSTFKNRKELSDKAAKKYKDLTAYQEQLADILWDTFVMISNFTPIPLQSISREIEGFFVNASHLRLEGGHYKTTPYTVKDAILAGLGFEQKDSLMAYNAIKNNEEEVLRRMKSSKSWESWVRKGLQNYDEGTDRDKEALNRIEKAAAANYSGDYETYERLIGKIESDGFERNDIIAAIEGLVGEMRPEEDKNPPADKHLYTFKMLEDAIRQNNDNAVNDIREKLKAVEGKTDDNIKSAIKDIAGKYYSKGDEKTAVGILERYGGMNGDEIKEELAWWNFKEVNPDSELPKASWQSWRTKASSGRINNGRGKISASEYERYTKAVRGIKGDDLDGDGKSDPGTKKKKILDAIDKLPLSDDQKDTLYLMSGYSRDDIALAPWH